MSSNKVAKEKENTKKDRRKFFIFILLIVAVIVISTRLNLHSYFEVEKIRMFIDSYGIYGPLIYILLYIIASLFFLPGSILTITSGILFGTVKGTVYAVIGAALGATCAFIVARYFARPYVEDITKQKLQRLRDYDLKLKENGFSTVLFLRLVPLFPFNGLNFGLGITSVKLKDYVLATVIGTIPGTFAYVYFGDSLAMLDPINIIIAVIFLILLGLILPIHKRINKRKITSHSKN